METGQQFTLFDFDKSKEEYHKSDVAMKEFLSKVGDEDFDENPKGKLAFWSWAFCVASIEFATVFYFMGDKLGNAGSIYAAGLAAFLILCASLCFARGNAWAAKNYTISFRLIGILVQLGAIVFFLYGLGLLSNYRSDVFSTGFQAVLEGYKSIFTDIEIFVTALFNAVGFGYLSYEARKAFWAKYPGFREIKNRLEIAEQNFKELVASNNDKESDK